MSVQNLKMSPKLDQTRDLNAAAVSFQSTATSEGANVKGSKAAGPSSVSREARSRLQAAARNEIELMKSVIFADPARPDTNAGLTASGYAADRLDGQVRANSGQGKDPAAARKVIKDQIQSMMGWNPAAPDNDKNRVAGSILMNALTTRGW
jgi:hypothetical protein